MVVWSGSRDSNPGPHAPKARTLASCATPRKIVPIKSITVIVTSHFHAKTSSELATISIQDAQYITRQTFLQYKQLMESHFLFHQSYFTKCH